MAKCKKCGEEIIWIRTSRGKAMPCNPKRIPFVRDPMGRFMLVTMNGETVRASIDIESDEYGYESHWSTCPAADDFRNK